MLMSDLWTWIIRVAARDVAGERDIPYLREKATPQDPTKNTQSSRNGLKLIRDQARGP